VTTGTVLAGVNSDHQVTDFKRKTFYKLS